MASHIELIKQIRQNLSKDWKFELVDYNMPETFSNIYTITNIEDANKIITEFVSKNSN